MSISPVPSSPVATAAPSVLPESLVPPASAPVAPVSEIDNPSLKPDDRTLQEAVATLNSSVQPWSRQLKFEIDEDSGRVVIQVLDAQSGEVIRQIPGEEVMEMSMAMGRLKDLAFRAEA